MSSSSSGLVVVGTVLLVAAGSLLGGAGCDPSEPGTDVADGGGDAGPDVVVDADADAETGTEEIQVPPVLGVEANGFATSEECKSCHRNREGSSAMRTRGGAGVGMHDLWKASMMANATRDPFWRAAVSAEMARSPGAAEAIERKCMRCHAPMAHTAAERRGRKGVGLDLLDRQTNLSHLARDGVSCTGCHQIEPDELGTPASFTGRFVMSESKVAYGPYADPHAEPMENRSGFEPVRGDHIRESRLCASCHTLYTDPVDAQGQPTSDAHFPEQTPFLEWKNSTFYDPGDGSGEECQGCHEPTTDAQGRPIQTQIATNRFGEDFPTGKVPERSPYGRHLFIGGNTLVPAMLRDHRDVLNPVASDAAFDELIDEVERQLQERTADVRVVDASRSGGRLEVEVEIEVRTGHKFPTGYPSRRAWLRVAASGADGDRFFRSGGYDERGRLRDGDGDVLESEKPGGPIQPHRDVVGGGDEVQIYQSIMENASGEPTWRLMRAADYAKDNRLLPKGWSSNHPAIDDIAPVGVGGDSDFAGGTDRVTYQIPVPDDASPPYQVAAALVYQVLSHRFARELFRVDTRAVRVFRGYWRKADTAPVRVDRATTTVR